MARPSDYCPLCKEKCSPTEASQREEDKRPDLYCDYCLNLKQKPQLACWLFKGRLSGNNVGLPACKECAIALRRASGICVTNSSAATLQKPAVDTKHSTNAKSASAEASSIPRIIENVYLLPKKQGPAYPIVAGNQLSIVSPYIGRKERVLKLQRGGSDATGHPKDTRMLRDLLTDLAISGEAVQYNLKVKYRADLPATTADSESDFYLACKDKGPLLIALTLSNGNRQGFFWCRPRGARSCKVGLLANDFCAYWETKKQEIITTTLVDSTLFLTEKGLHYQLEGQEQCLRVSEPDKLQLPSAGLIVDDAVPLSVVVYSFGP